GITVLVSSHILEELSKIATHFGFIDAGKIVKEMSAAELEKACRKCIEITVSDTKILSRILDEKNLEYSLLSDTEARIFGEIDVTELTLKLHDNHCTVQTIRERNESLESFYINLVGGEE
ncbi:MAG: ABC transporter ATP-binding protein, partial [Clostridia bacterium]|nr:ABC transporter ATP-binding protein [Clostridia bacterium]